MKHYFLIGHTVRLPIITTGKKRLVIIAGVFCAMLCVFALCIQAEIISAQEIGNKDTHFFADELPIKSAIIPYGAPDTGFGGSAQLERMNANAALPLLMVVLLMLFGSGAFCAIRDWKDAKKTI